MYGFVQRSRWQASNAEELVVLQRFIREADEGLVERIHEAIKQRGVQLIDGLAICRVR